MLYNSEVEEIKEVAEWSESQADSNKSSKKYRDDSQGTMGDNKFKLNIQKELTLTVNTGKTVFNSEIKGIGVKNKLDKKVHKTIEMENESDDSIDYLDSQKKVEIGG